MKSLSLVDHLHHPFSKLALQVLNQKCKVTGAVRFRSGENPPGGVLAHLEYLLLPEEPSLLIAVLVLPHV